MPVTLQVIYPVTEGTKFDHAYYAKTHMQIVEQHMGPHIQSSVVAKGLAGGPHVPAPFYAIATFVFADQAALDAAMQAAGPALEDIPNFTDVQPQILIGEVIS
ncbi:MULTISPECIES: EthD family reductase [Leisingera]|uniref:EthD family reductase n=1 Tax=Leisingera TaxID=191028 RepID=UPI000183B966|nr:MULTISPECIES: EthD family reductase [Leisingera]EDZ46848.1 ethyl tert-butyl ether degradation EthD [Rhodobacterales bacterium Y4I]UWQ38076.1 EthD family reductase [Leisingera aquaemixtae]